MIKFRVWDKINKSFNTEKFIIFSDGQLAMLMGAFYEDVKEDDYIIQQSTGLMDHDNKREIYEGDVISRLGHLNVIKFGAYEFKIWGDDGTKVKSNAVGFYTQCYNGTDCCDNLPLPRSICYWGNICEARDVIAGLWPGLLEISYETIQSLG